MGLGFDKEIHWLYSNSIFAVRMVGDWSIGSNKLLHLLGGTDNVLFNFGSITSEIDPNVPYAYQARITHLEDFQIMQGMVLMHLL